MKRQLIFTEDDVLKAMKAASQKTQAKFSVKKEVSGRWFVEIEGKKGAAFAYGKTLCGAIWKAILVYGDDKEQYLKLFVAFPPRPIATEEKLKETQKVIDSLIDKSELTPDEQDYLNVLGSLVRDYENLHPPFEA